MGFYISVAFVNLPTDRNFQVSPTVTQATYLTDYEFCQFLGIGLRESILKFAEFWVSAPSQVPSFQITAH